jgi:4-hydroxyphenylpyruvate dioxygenase
MRRSIATVCLSGTLEERLEAAAAAGFDGVELFENDLVGSPLPPSEVRRRADDLGLAIDLYQPFRDFEAVPPHVLARNLRRAEAKFAVMEQLGATTMLVCSNVSADAIDDDALAAEQLHALAARAAEWGMRIAYEALAWGRHVHEYDHSWRIARAADHPSLGVCLDSFHILSRGTDLAAIAQIPAEKLFYLQLADAPQLAMDVLQWSRHYRCFPGQGGFDLPGFVRRVLDAGYDGPLSLEVFNDVFRQADPERTAIDAMRSLIVLEDRLGLAPLPPAAALAGYAFVELGVDAESAPATEALLRSMGFVHVGPHRSKPVQLWEHGDTRIVLNHGAGDDDPEVVAIAVESEDPGRSAERAEALLAPVLERRRDPGEAELAAVAAPDDTSVFFCRTARADGWLADFVALGTDGNHDRGAPVPIRRVDHIALAQPFESFDEAVLFYGAVLGLEPTESQDLASPDGLVRSRAVASRDGGVRFALNVPALASPLHGQGELQHVAFACDDALEAARAMRDRGVPLLPIPENYYDDLQARIDLDPELLAALRELGVLYDRSAGGELLHFYTARIGGRVFFEVLERRGAYERYGAVNSPVRMAAQRAAITPVA